MPKEICPFWFTHPCVPSGTTSLPSREARDHPTRVDALHKDRRRQRPEVSRDQLKTELTAAVKSLKLIERLEKDGRLKPLPKPPPPPPPSMPPLTDPLQLARCHTVAQLSYRRFNQPTYEMQMYHVNPTHRMKRDDFVDYRKLMFMEWNTFGRPQTQKKSAGKVWR